ncbi:MAG: gamma carbonic anhydrase family protein [Deltaproteobacteria bacterium]|nr:gamma carbonic anhydrase family protein [Deltaproteobacteria bacterium]
MPDIHPSVYVAPTAFVSGDVTVGKDSSLWPGASLRGDMGSITVGKGSSIQDSCALHVQPGGVVAVGDLVTVGHGAVLHGCSVGNCTVIGMNATVLDNARVGEKCIIAAGAVVKPGITIPDNALVVGLSEIKENRVTDLTMNWYGALLYIALARQYKAGATSFDQAEMLKEAENLKEEYPMP